MIRFRFISLKCASFFSFFSSSSSSTDLPRGRAPYPTPSTTLAMSSGVTLSFASTVMISVAKLTLALSTPGILLTAFSIVMAHEAQLIPSIMYSFCLLITFTAFVYICNLHCKFTPSIYKCQQESLKNFLNKKTQANSDSASLSFGIVYLIC